MIHTRTKIIALISLGICLATLSVYLGVFWMLKDHKAQLGEECVRAAEADVQARALSALEETVANSQGERAKLQSYILKDEAIIYTIHLSLVSFN